MLFAEAYNLKQQMCKCKLSSCYRPVKTLNGCAVLLLQALVDLLILDKPLLPFSGWTLIQVRNTSPNYT